MKNSAGRKARPTRQITPDKCTHRDMVPCVRMNEPLRRWRLGAQALRSRTPARPPDDCEGRPSTVGPLSKVPAHASSKDALATSDTGPAAVDVQVRGLSNLAATIKKLLPESPFGTRAIRDMLEGYVDQLAWITETTGRPARLIAQGEAAPGERCERRFAEAGPSGPLRSLASRRSRSYSHATTSTTRWPTSIRWPPTGGPKALTRGMDFAEIEKATGRKPSHGDPAPKRKRYDPGSHQRLEWKFKDGSRLVVDKPARAEIHGSSKPTRPATAELPHVEVHGPGGERLDPQGIEIPEKSAPAHLTVRDQRHWLEDHFAKQRKGL
jgi:hypothetical protein